MYIVYFVYVALSKNHTFPLRWLYQRLAAMTSERSRRTLWFW